MKDYINLWTSVEYDYESLSVEEYGRDRKILNPKVTYINLNDTRLLLYQYMMQKFKGFERDNLINFYCFDRILSYYKIYELSNYGFDICDGYYGDELNGVFFKKENEVFDRLKELLNLKLDIDKIEYILDLEYGYLIDSVANKSTAKIITDFDLEKIKVYNIDYYTHLETDVLTYYEKNIPYHGFNLPVAIVRKHDYDYKLVDGHHRVLTLIMRNAKNETKTHYSVISLE